MANGASSDMSCKYVYKQCSNPRTIKRDGSLHRLCEFHRNKANALQKVYATKRRRELRAERRTLITKKEIETKQIKNETIEPVMKIETFQECDLIFLNELWEPIEPTTDFESLSDEEFAYISAVL